MHGCRDSSTALSLTAVPMFSRASPRQVNISNFCQDCDEYRGSNGSPEPANGIDLHDLFDQDLMCSYDEDAVATLEERMSASRTLLKKADCAVFDFRNGYIDLVHHLAGEVMETCRKYEVDRRELAARDGIAKELNLKASSWPMARRRWYAQKHR